MRGKHNKREQYYQREGITPAHAGKTHSKGGSALMRRDHPRACGENGQLLCFVGNGQGSPPRMRGKQPCKGRGCRIRRITPAHAGKTEETTHVCAIVQDHPRACGENLKSRVCPKIRTGSPPRMRGKLTDDDTMLMCQRITPAHAGKTVQI